MQSSYREGELGSSIFCVFWIVDSDLNHEKAFWPALCCWMTKRLLLVMILAAKVLARSLEVERFTIFRAIFFSVFLCYCKCQIDWFSKVHSRVYQIFLSPALFFYFYSFDTSSHGGRKLSWGLTYFWWDFFLVGVCSIFLRHILRKRSIFSVPIFVLAEG